MKIGRLGFFPPLKYGQRLRMLPGWLGLGYKWLCWPGNPLMTSTVWFRVKDYLLVRTCWWRPKSPWHLNVAVRSRRPWVTKTRSWVSRG